MAAVGLGEDEFVVRRVDVDALHDQLYVLEAAIEDVERDLGSTSRPTARDYREAIEWLLDAARPLVAMRVGGTSTDEA